MIASFGGPPNRFEPRAGPPSRKVRIICYALNLASVSVIGYVLFRWIGG